ncbi:MAG: DNA polymerase III subunit beta [Streptosporangiales bacterium]|nr:DNA polymerase III subunit beta [Streptosporangiales bacterium]MBO0890259.1 DNA polymerase III subunit beta [Acidothermales bacterium]
MRINAQTAELARAAGFAARHASVRPVLPVLSGLRLTARGDDVTVTGYDYEASSVATLSADVTVPGDVLVPGRVFAEILRALPDAEVTVTRKDASVRIESTETEFTLPLLPIEDYPNVPGTAPTVGTIDAATLSAAVAAVSRVALRDESVPLLSGVSVEIAPDAVSLMTTDRYRIARHELPWSAGPVERTGAVVPARLLADAVKGIGGSGELTVGLAPSVERRLSLSRGGAASTIRLLDGTYPDVLRGMPTAFAGEVVVERESLAAAVRRIALVADQYAAVVLDVADGGVVVSASGEGEMGGRTRLPAVQRDEPARIAVNAGYLLDGLGMVDGGYAKLSYQRTVRPALIQGCADADGRDVGARSRYYVMPRVPPE